MPKPKQVIATPYTYFDEKKLTTVTATKIGILYDNDEFWMLEIDEDGEKTWQQIDIEYE